MSFPDFFDKVPTISLREPLAVFLGASTTGEITYTYADAVKLAGHSCPTVAAAYLMVREGLRYLYGDDLPERGGIEVYMRDGRETGTTGVTASIATLLTGAASETGFGGIGERQRFGRRNLLQFDADIDGVLALRRRDTGRGVSLDFNAAPVPPDPGMRTLFPDAVSGRADEVDQKRFAQLWQDRVARILLDHADDPELVRARAWDTASS